MPVDLRRRGLLAASLAAAAALPAWRVLAGPGSAADKPLDALARLEARHGGRLGVAILDMADGRRINHRGEERFLMCSTFKWLLAAQALARVDAGEESLDAPVAINADDLVVHSPVTEAHVDAGMTVAALCEAAVTRSDNAAANLLLARQGGPAGFTAFVRAIGDDWTRLDRIEPGLNVPSADGLLDTTTPAAMLRDLRAVLVGDVLQPASRDRLAGWLVGNRTGDARLRAGMPATWRIGDKTGTGGDGPANDVAIAWPPGRAPLLVTAYYDSADATPVQRDAVIADVGRIAAGLVARA